MNDLKDLLANREQALNEIREATERKQSIEAHAIKLLIDQRAYELLSVNWPQAKRMFG